VSACAGETCQDPSHDHGKGTDAKPFVYRGGVVALSTKDGAPANRAQRRAWAKRNGVPPGNVVRPKQ
jgi:hypothetical protein